MTDEPEAPKEDPLAGLRASSPDGEDLLKEYYGGGDDEPITRIHVIDAPARPRSRLITNAPPEWPPVLGPPRCEGDPDAFVNTLSLLIAQALRKAGIRVVEYHKEVELGEFLLVIDLVVEHGGVHVPVLILPGVDPGEERQDFEVARAGLAKAGPFTTSPVVFYAPSGESPET